MFAIDKSRLLGNIHMMRRATCCYDMYRPDQPARHEPEFCDCKYGSEGFGDSRYTSEQTGCPELRLVEQLLMHMTEAEFAEILKRGQNINPNLGWGDVFEEKDPIQT